MIRYIFIACCILFFQCAMPFYMSMGRTGIVRDSMILPNASIIYSEGYKVLETSEGESSTLFFLGLFPLSNPLNVDYAMSQAVFKVQNGQSLVNVKIWHETHYYFPVGRVSVVKVKGDVVSFAQDVQPLFEDKTNTVKPNAAIGGKK